LTNLCDVSKQQSMPLNYFSRVRGIYANHGEKMPHLKKWTSMIDRQVLISYNFIGQDAYRLQESSETWCQHITLCSVQPEPRRCGKFGNQEGLEMDGNVSLNTKLPANKAQSCTCQPDELNASTYKYNWSNYEVTSNCACATRTCENVML
jgi:hypothetical protein